MKINHVSSWLPLAPWFATHNGVIPLPFFSPRMVVFPRFHGSWLSSTIRFLFFSFFKHFILWKRRCILCGCSFSIASRDITRRARPLSAHSSPFSFSPSCAVPRSQNPVLNRLFPRFLTRLITEYFLVFPAGTPPQQQTPSLFEHKVFFSKPCWPPHRLRARPQNSFATPPPSLSFFLPLSKLLFPAPFMPLPVAGGS